MKRFTYLEHCPYPRTHENIRAIILYYFPNYPLDKLEEDVMKIYSKNKFTLSQIHQYTYIISLSNEFFNFHLTTRNIENEMSYLSDAIHLDTITVHGSANRINITREYKVYLIKSGLI